MLVYIKKLVPQKIKIVICQCWNALRDTSRKDYLRGSQLGKDSDNAWIRKSATVQGWLFEGEHEFLWHLATQSREGHILEIGSWMGKSACILAGACSEFAPETKVFCVDPFSMAGTAQQKKYHRILLGAMESTFETFCANANRLGFRDFVIPVAAFSTNSLPFFNTSLRLGFIDGAHDYINAKKDAELVLPLVRKNGFLAFHDADNDTYPELKQLMDDLRKRDDLVYYKTVGTIVAFQKVS